MALIQTNGAKTWIDLPQPGRILRVASWNFSMRRDWNPRRWCVCDKQALAHGSDPRKEIMMGLGTILLIVLVLILLGVIPTWPHSRSWGYGPSGIVGVLLVVLLILLLMGRL
jgi:hypothetical protein